MKDAWVPVQAVAGCAPLLSVIQEEMRSTSAALGRLREKQEARGGRGTKDATNPHGESEAAHLS
jgi:hypothetical protein